MKHLKNAFLFVFFPKLYQFSVRKSLLKTDEEKLRNEVYRAAGLIGRIVQHVATSVGLAAKSTASSLKPRTDTQVLIGTAKDTAALAKRVVTNSSRSTKRKILRFGIRQVRRVNNRLAQAT